MTRTVRAALTETRNVADLGGARDVDRIRDANVRHHVDLVERAAARGVRVIGLGELFPAPYFALERDESWLGLAESVSSGTTVRAMTEAARRHGMVVVAPIFERDDETGERFNTAVVIDADGTVLGRFRKVHVPCGVNDRGSFHETFYYRGSDGRLGPLVRNVSANPFFPVFATRVGRVGVAICYDRHFEGVMATLARNGAEIVFSPAVTFGAQSRRMWEQEFAVDALRHSIFIGGSNRKGSEPPFAIEYFGGSHFVGPAGPRPNRSDDDRLVIADLDLDDLAAGNGSGWDLRRDARPEAYGR